LEKERGQRERRRETKGGREIRESGRKRQIPETKRENTYRTLAIPQKRGGRAEQEGYPISQAHY